MKIIIRNIILGIALLFSVQTVEAQQLPVMNHYLYNPYLYNPARTGDMGTGSINLNFKRQWTSMPYAPITGALSIEAPVSDSRMGLGGMLYSDQTHIVNRIGGMGTYAYHVPFSKEYAHHLSGGASLGFIHQSFDFESASVEQQNDPEILGDEATGTAFDFSLGLNYRWRDLNVGFSMMQGLNNQIRFLGALGEEVRYVNSRHFIGTASYDVRFGQEEEFMVRPVVMTRFIAGLPVQVEGNVLFNWKRILWAGLGYRSSNNETSTSAISASIGVELKKRIFFAYTFETGADARLNNALGTQHEFMITYRFGNNQAQDKEMLSMREEIDQLKEKDKFLTEKITETNQALDSLQDQNQVMGDQIADIQKTTSDLKTSNDEVTENIQKKLDMQQDLLNSQQKLINKNREAIDELRQAIKSKPLKYKKLGEVSFGNASSELTAAEKSKLDALKAEIADKSDYTVYLYGNASTDGDPNQNLELSAKRCISVRKYLVSLGVPGDKVVLLPMGQNNTSDGTSNINPQDRRVDIMLGKD